MSSRSVLRVGVFGVYAVAAGCSVDAPAPGTHAAAITNGAVDEGDPAVVALVAAGRIFCTGTLIAPRVVITAGHCIGRREVTVFFGTALAAGGELRGVADQRAHPGFDAVRLEHDVGALLLAGPAPAGVTPVPMRWQPLPATFVGDEVRIVGFGLTSAAPGAASGTKHAAMTVVDALDQRSFTFGSSASQTCMGDSGGPAFMTFDGVETLVGVTSAGDPRCEAYGRDMRVDAYAAELIVPYVEATAAVGSPTGERCFLADNCASGRCEFPADAPAIGYCTSACARDADCPAAMSCDAGAQACRYPTPSPGAFAAACSADFDCDSRLCARPAGRADAICTSPCLPAVPETCPAEAVCVEPGPDGEASLCDAPASAAGCAVGSRGGEPLGPVLLGLSLWAIVGRRRARVPW